MTDLASVVLEQLQAVEARPLRLRKTFYQRVYNGPASAYTHGCWEAKENCDISIESTPARFVISGDKVGALHVAMEEVPTVIQLIDSMRESCWKQVNDVRVAKVQFSIMSPGREGKSLVVFTHLFSRYESHSQPRTRNDVP